MACILLDYCTFLANSQVTHVIASLQLLCIFSRIPLTHFLLFLPLHVDMHFQTKHGKKTVTLLLLSPSLWSSHHCLRAAMLLLVLQITLTGFMFLMVSAYLGYVSSCIGTCLGFFCALCSLNLLASTSCSYSFSTLLWDIALSGI